MGCRKGGTSFRLKRADILALREQRIEAVIHEWPRASPKRCRELVGDWYRGKPGTGIIGKCIEKAGLL